MREERIKSILNVISKQNDISLPYLDTLKIVDIKEEQTGDAILICTVNRGDVSEDVLKKYKNDEIIIELEFEEITSTRLTIYEKKYYEIFN
jgi:hypothetical protein